MLLNGLGVAFHVAEGLKESGRVEFVLWKAGEQGHTEDYWHLMGIGWENHFEPYDN